MSILTPDSCLLTPDADRQLGELLQHLDLIEAETLAGLLLEARRQRRSLRQILLAGGYLTLYQLALIEASNLDGLALGPLRVVDRLRSTAHETVYRVFDPRRGCETILRHLAESEMHDAVRPDEFRQRFGALAAVQHPNLAATLEVLEIQGRPGAVQERLQGLAAPDWPALAGVSGVWFRLVGQAALGMHTAHQAGLIHGRLQAPDLLLTEAGLVKIMGVGEPAWLHGDSTPPEGDPRQDVSALGQIAASWLDQSAVRKPAKSKGLSGALQRIVKRLTGDPALGYGSAADLLDDLDQAGADVAANAEAWERLVRHVRDTLAGAAPARLSA